MKKSWEIKSLVHARLEVPGRREPLSFGETHPYLGELPEKVLYYKGERKVSVKEIITEEKKADPPAPVPKTPSLAAESDLGVEPEESVSEADALSSDDSRSGKKSRKKNRG